MSGRGRKRDGRTKSKPPVAPPAPPVWDKDEYARVPPGNYVVLVIAYDGPDWVRKFQRNSLRLECAPLDDPSKRLSLFFNFGGSEGCIAVPGRLSKYTQHWTMANGEPPRRGQAMNWDVFVGKWFVAEVADAKENSDGDDKPDCEVYSRIERFVRVWDAPTSPQSGIANQESGIRNHTIKQSGNQPIKGAMQEDA